MSRQNQQGLEECCGWLALQTQHSMISSLFLPEVIDLGAQRLLAALSYPAPSFGHRTASRAY
jgi:hypothetical protein